MAVVFSKEHDVPVAEVLLVLPKLTDRSLGKSIRGVQLLSSVAPIQTFLMFRVLLDITG